MDFHHYINILKVISSLPNKKGGNSAAASKRGQRNNRFKNESTQRPVRKGVNSFFVFFFARFRLAIRKL